MPEKKLFRPRTYRIYAPDPPKRGFVEYYQDGERIRVGRGINGHATAARRRKAAEELIEELKKEHRNLRPLSDTEKELRAYLEEGRSGWSLKTYRDYRAKLSALWKWLHGREITEVRLREFLAAKKKVLHPTTWNKYRTVLRRALLAVGCPDWFDRIPQLKATSTPDRYFQTHQAAQLGAYMKEHNPPLALFVKFIFYTLIRPGELRQLKAGDIEFDTGKIRVPGKVAKTGVTRYAVIPDAFRAELEFIKELSPGQFVFQRKGGGKIGTNRMYEAHRRCLEALEFGDGYTLYSWKHTGAVSLANAGVSVKQIMLQAGHASLDETDGYLRQMGVRDMDDLREKAKRPF